MGLILFQLLLHPPKANNEIMSLDLRLLLLTNDNRNYRYPAKLRPDRILVEPITEIDSKAKILISVSAELIDSAPT